MFNKIPTDKLLHLLSVLRPRSRGVALFRAGYPRLARSVRYPHSAHHLILWWLLFSPLAKEILR